MSVQSDWRVLWRRFDNSGIHLISIFLFVFLILFDPIFDLAAQVRFPMAEV